MKKLLLSIFLLFVAIDSHGYLGSSLSVPPHAGYQEFRSEHFYVIFPKEFEDEAHQVGHHLEKAHDLLSPFFNYAPSRRTTVIVTDHMDFANGVATAIGHQGLVIFLAPPEPYSSIGEYGDWLESLVFHEYTHYLVLDQTDGPLFDGLRILFGDVVLPNQFWPGWLNEGLAVYVESAFTQQGRGHGAYFTTITRDAVYRDILNTRKFLMYDQISGPRPDFPFGGTIYYTGFGIIDQMAKSYGQKTIGKLTNEGAYHIPYFLDTTLQSAGGNTFQELWSDWTAGEATRLKPETDWLKRRGTKDPEFLTKPGDSGIGTRISPDGKKAAYILNSGRERSGIHLVDLRTKEDREIVRAVAGAGLSWSPDGNRLYYSHAEFNGPYALYSDVYYYDLKEDDTTRLTWGERAKDPSYCPGNKVVFITHKGRFSQLKVLDLKSKEITTIFETKANHHISNPRCSKNRSRVYFSYHDRQPLEAVYAIPLSGGKATKLFGGRGSGYRALFPEPTESGDVYFTRVRNKFFELAKWNRSSRSISTIAKASGGFWLPSVEAGKVGVSYVSSLGIRAGVYNLSDLRSSRSRLTGAPRARTPDIDKLSATKKLRPSGYLKAESYNYNFFRSLAPRIWTPHLAISKYRNEYGATVLGWDDLDQFSYQLNLRYSNVVRGPEGYITTLHRIKTFNLGTIAASQLSSYVVQSGNIAQHSVERRLGAFLARPFPGVFSNITPLISAEWARNYFTGKIGNHVSDSEARLGASVAWSTIESYPYSLLPERGRFVKLSGLRFVVRDQVRTWKGMLQWNEILPISFPRQSSLRFNGFAAATSSIKPGYIRTPVLLGGFGSVGTLNPPLRGYPFGSIETTRAGVLQTEFRFPLAQIFEGPGHIPLFFRNAGAYLFFDAATVQVGDNNKFSRMLGGAGGGVLANTIIGYNLPVQIRIEFSKGLRPEFDGQNMFAILLGMVQ